MITLEDALSLVNYDPSTGEFTWNKPRPKCTPGSRAGSVTRYGYLKICLNHKNYMAHRVAWLIVNGEWPKSELDHINGNRLDNRICNLREATPHQNQANKGMRSDNTSGVKGVTWDKSRGKWMAAISFYGRHVFLGRYSTINAAEKAYNEGAERYFGEYSRPERK